MKTSKYNLLINYDDTHDAVYNLLHRNYILFPVESRETMNSILENPNSAGESDKNAPYFTRLLGKNMVIGDDENELDYIKFMENRNRYNDRVLNIMLMPTMNCNFGCTYCYQPNENRRFTDQTAKNIIKFVSNYAKEVKVIYLSWFGGEPTIEHDRVIQMTQAIRTICEESNVKLFLQMTTNGYLLSEERVRDYKNIGMNSLQITIDGTEETHDERRMLLGGGKTYTQIKDNIQLVLDAGINLTLRMNVDPENYDQLSSAMDVIPEGQRDLVRVSIGNLHQANENLSFHDQYVLSIDKGYKYQEFRNEFAVCEANYKHGFTVSPEGDVVLCSFDNDEKSVIGRITEQGSFQVSDKVKYIRSRTISALDNPDCTECINLPICTGSCVSRRMKDNSKCLNKAADGMSPEERAHVHIYNDISHRLLKEADIL